MEASQLSFLASLTSSIAYAGFKGYGICKSHYKTRIFCLLCSNTEGISELLNELEIDTTLVQPIIVEKALEEYLNEEKLATLNKLKETKSPYYNVFVFKHFNEYLKILKRANKNTIFVVITSSLKLIKDLKVKKENVSMLLPNVKYYLKLLERVEDRELDQQNRENMIHLDYPKFYFSGKSGLINILSKMFVKNSEANNYV